MNLAFLFHIHSSKNAADSQIFCVVVRLHDCSFQKLQYCTASNYSSWHCTVLHYTTLHWSALHYIGSQCTALHFIILHCISLYSTSLYYVALCCSLKNLVTQNTLIVTMNSYIVNTKHNSSRRVVQPSHQLRVITSVSCQSSVAS